MKRSDGTFDNTERILYCQDKFNETGDVKYIWEMLDDLRHCIQSLAFKRLKGNPTQTVYENSIECAEKWALDFIKRRNNGNPYHMTNPISYASFILRRWWRTDDTIINTAVDIPEVTDYVMGSYEDTFDYDPYTVEMDEIMGHNKEEI